MSDTDKAIANLIHISGILGDAMEKAVQCGAKRIQAAVKQLLPVETGRLMVEEVRQ